MKRKIVAMLLAVATLFALATTAIAEESKQATEIPTPEFTIEDGVEYRYDDGSWYMQGPDGTWLQYIGLGMWTAVEYVPDATNSMIGGEDPDEPTPEPSTEPTVEPTAEPTTQPAQPATQPATHVGNTSPNTGAGLFAFLAD